jgi:HD-GYP domain-containing protein (c-di-GMP phosphodiesterase class II)
MVTGRISLAWGCATKSRQEESLQDIYRTAENKMYQRKIHERAQVRRETMAFIMTTLYERIPREQQHAERVGYLCGLLGRAMHLSSGEVENLEVLGELHDIGKITLSSLILDKLEPLEPEEWEEVKLHPEASYKILSSVNAWASLGEAVLAHHEHFDGTGYPKGLRGEEIPLEARILAVADAFEAITWGRPYKKALSWREAGEELRRCSGTQFDPRIVEVFLNLLHSGKILFPESKGFHR